MPETPGWTSLTVATVQELELAEDASNKEPPTGEKDVDHAAVLAASHKRKKDLSLKNLKVSSLWINGG